MLKPILAALALLAASRAAAGSDPSSITPESANVVVDAAALQNLGNIAVLSGGGDYDYIQSGLLSRIETGLAGAGCWSVMKHGEADQAFSHVEFDAPSSGTSTWDNAAGVAYDILGNAPPKSATERAYLVVWVVDWHGDLQTTTGPILDFTRKLFHTAAPPPSTSDQGCTGWDGKQLPQPITTFVDRKGHLHIEDAGPPTLPPCQYSREVVAELISGATGGLIWKGRADLSYLDEATIDGDRVVAFADQTDNDVAQVANYLVDGLRQPTQMADACALRTGADAALEALKGGSAATDKTKEIEDLKSADPSVRTAAAKALGRKYDEKGVKPLIAALSDPVLEVRAYALDGLGKIGSVRAVDAVTAKLADPDKLLRALAARSLGRIGSGRAVPALEKRLNVEKEPLVRQQIDAAITRIRDPLNMIHRNLDDMLPQDHAGRSGDPRRF